MEQIAAKVGKAPACVAQRLKLTELSAPVVDAFYAEEIGVGHDLLLAKLQPAQQEQASANCSREEWNGAGAKAKRILLPVRQARQSARSHRRKLRRLSEAHGAQQTALR